jgi:crotonobetainyl-CoA:carnitine CoA-transferase CaiB-like acyl-CoA transferase
VNGFGEESIYPGRPALDTVVQAMSGLMDVTRVDGMPMKAGISASDNLGGQFALLSLVAAIHLRDRTTKSVHFDLSMQEASAWATQFEWNQAPKESEPALIKTKDGYVAVEAEEKVVRQFLASEGFLAESETRAHVVEALDTNFPSAPVLTVGEVVGHAQTAARRLLVERSTCNGDSWLVLSTPFKMNSTPVEVRSVISDLGIGESQVYDALGLTRSHVQRN